MEVDWEMVEAEGCEALVRLEVGAAAMLAWGKERVEDDMVAQVVGAAVETKVRLESGFVKVASKPTLAS